MTTFAPAPKVELLTGFERLTLGRQLGTSGIRRTLSKAASPGAPLPVPQAPANSVIFIAFKGNDAAKVLPVVHADPSLLVSKLIALAAESCLIRQKRWLAAL